MRVTIKLLLIALLGTLSYHHASAQEPSFNERYNVPIWATPVLRGEPFTNEYLLSTRVNPFLIQGDFNGDGRIDIAVLITRREDGHRGIAILHAGASQPIILGAGQPYRDGTVGDFNWPVAWSVYPKGPVGEYPDEGPPPKLLGDALLVIKPEAASAIIYWDGGAYRWYQQDD